jgi:hypothetical protein
MNTVKAWRAGDDKDIAATLPDSFSLLQKSIFLLSRIGYNLEKKGDLRPKHTRCKSFSQRKE